MQVHHDQAHACVFWRNTDLAKHHRVETISLLDLPSSHGMQVAPTSVVPISTGVAAV